MILVSTAADEHDETYVPNPILQRVLRSAFQQELVKDNNRTPFPAFNGVDEVDRPYVQQPVQTQAQSAYQKLPLNSQIYQSQSHPSQSVTF